ncbi:hypothetical protein [Dongia sp.]|uniref:hypothetical protein n=1 Tax=Dongia sp. TaxID=1977262 RepID=UPI0035B18515
MAKTSWKGAILLAAAMVLQGCNTTTIPTWVSGTTAYAAVEGISLNQTGKTASDHLASLATGDDCSILDYTKTGKYCRTAAEIAQEQAEKNRPYPGYCYRQRATVICYDTPDRTATDALETYPEAHGW